MAGGWGWGAGKEIKNIVGDLSLKRTKDISFSEIGGMKGRYTKSVHKVPSHVI